MNFAKETTVTLIRVTYTKYAENIRVTNEQDAKQLRNLLATDEEVVSWEVYHEGAYEFFLEEPTQYELKEAKVVRSSRRRWCSATYWNGYKTVNEFSQEYTAQVKIFYVSPVTKQTTSKVITVKYGFKSEETQKAYSAAYETIRVWNLELSRAKQS